METEVQEQKKHTIYIDVEMKGNKEVVEKLKEIHGLLETARTLMRELAAMAESLDVDVNHYTE